jgi:type IV pilus assembly protein PilC
MFLYQYTARNATSGESVKSTVEAENENEAAKLLQKQGLVPIDIKLDRGSNLGVLGKYFNRVRTKDRILFSRQLSTLINAGLPLIQSMRNVADQTTSKSLKTVIEGLITSVEGGSSLSAAAAKYPEVFNKLFISLVAAGEVSGTLDKALERLADQQEKDADIISKIRGAMMYPIIVLIVMFGVIAFMVIKLLPAVQNLYSTFPGAQLPLITRILLSMVHAFTHYWWLVTIILAVLIFLFLRWRKSSGGRSVIDRVKMRAGPIGKLFMKIYMSRFSRTACTLVGSGVPLLQVLDITGDAVSNVHIQNSLKKAADKIKGGAALSDVLSKDPNFLPLVPSMIRIGEQSGTLEQMLDKVATYYEKEVDQEVNNINSLIEPILMVILGVAAILIVVAVLLPIYGLANQSSLSGG